MLFGRENFSKFADLRKYSQIQKNLTSVYFCNFLKVPTCTRFFGGRGIPPFPLLDPPMLWILWLLFFLQFFLYFKGFLERNGKSESSKNSQLSRSNIWLDLINGKKVTPAFSPQRALNKKREYSTLIFYKGSFPFRSNLTWKKELIQEAFKPPSNWLLLAFTKLKTRYLLKLLTFFLCWMLKKKFFKLFKKVRTLNLFFHAIFMSLRWKFLSETNYIILVFESKIAGGCVFSLWTRRLLYV